MKLSELGTRPEAATWGGLVIPIALPTSAVNTSLSKIRPFATNSKLVKQDFRVLHGLISYRKHLYKFDPDILDDREAPLQHLASVQFQPLTRTTRDRSWPRRTFTLNNALV